MTRPAQSLGSRVQLWLMTAAALLIACLAVAEAFEQDPAIEPPPAITLPAPANGSQEAAEQQFYIIPADAIARVGEVIEAQKQEIERLREKLVQGGCS